MVKRDHSDYEDVVPLPVSTREPGEGAGLLANGGNSSDKHVGAFDLEFDIEDDVLLHWQHARPNSWLFQRLPRSLQQVPECWLRLSKQQRNLVVSGTAVCSVMLVCLIIVAAAWSGSSSSSRHSSSSTQQPNPQLMAAKDSPYCSWTDLYLPKVIHPTKYTLHVKTTLQEPYTVEGQVDIQLQAAAATPCVVLHAYGMDIKSADLVVYKQDDEDGHKQQVDSFKGSVLSSNTTSQQVTLQFPQAMPMQPLIPVLKLKFNYTLEEALDGFYRSTYIDAANETKIMASTQFESIAARKAFPCFDEPSFKAVFEVKVSAPPPPIVVLSNMPLSHTHEHEGEHHHDNDHGHDDDHEHEHEHDDDDDDDDHDHHAAPKKWTEEDLIAYHFKASPPMSSYLVAWVVGELSHNELQCKMDLPPVPFPTTSSGSAHDDSHDHHHKPAAGGDSTGRNVTVKVWGTNDRVQQFGHARDVACGALQEMERLFKIAYPLPKLDLVAIPNFAAGAMENWGLLMYREKALLVDDSQDDMHQRYAIATTVSHETAHQWFGNLATLDDWTQLWINEGLASYFEVVLGDAYQPGMGYFTNFFVDVVSGGLEADGSLASHPLSINRPIRQLAEIDNWFDDVSYSKGASVLRMLRAWINRNNAAATGLAGNSSAPSAADSKDSEHLSTSLQWAPHLRRLQQSSGSDSDSEGGSGASEQGERIVAAGVPRVLPLQAPGSSSHVSRSPSDSIRYRKKHRAGWGSRQHAKGPKVHPTMHARADKHGPQGQQQASAAAAGGGYDPSDVLVVLPVDAPVPRSAAAAAGPRAVSVGSSAGWAAAHQLQLQQQQGPPGRVLGGGVTADAGGDKFISGLELYLKTHAYGNSNYTGLLHSLAEASGEPVDEMMTVWALRRGFPIVTVSLGEQDGGSSRREVKVQQVPYHAPRTYMVGLPFEPEMYCNDWSDDPGDSSWWIPFPMRLPGADNNVEWRSFNSCSTSFKVDMPRNTPAWVLGNTGRFGFYRVNYSAPLWSELAKVAMSPHAHIGSVDFAGLLDDAYHLSYVRQLNITIFLDLVKALGTRARPELPPWSIALGWLQRMTDVLSTASLLGRNGQGERWKDCMSDLTKFVTRQVTEPFIKNVDVPGQDEPGLTFQTSDSDSPELRLLRPLVLESAGFLGYTLAMNTAVDLVAQQAAGQGNAVAPDVAKAVYALAAGSGSETAYNTLVNMYEQALDAADKDRALRALARVTTKPLISKTLEYALSPAVRTQDVSALLVGVAKQGGLGFNMTWEFIMDRADDVLRKYGVEDVTYSLGRELNQLARLFVDEDLLDRLRAFAKVKPQIFSPTFFEEANEARMLNHDWLRFQGTDACSWLTNAVQRGL